MKKSLFVYYGEPFCVELMRTKALAHKKVRLLSSLGHKFVFLFSTCDILERDSFQSSFKIKLLLLLRNNSLPVFLEDVELLFIYISLDGPV